jgi:hypothetical protein
MLNQPSLLDTLNEPTMPRPGAKPKRPKTIPWLRRHGRSALRDPRIRLVLGSCAGMLTLAGAIVGFATMIGPARPDYDKDRIDALFQYTLLTDEFNRLSVKERAELIGQLIQRVGSMGSSDSVLLAAFAATIQGEAREQLVENASRLFLDMIDEQAVKYDASLPRDLRVKQLEDSIIEMARLFETMGGQDNPTDPEQILEDAQRQAQRDQQRVQEGRVSAEEAGRVMTVLNQTLGQNASPHQTARGGRMLRDMTRHLRGQDIDTGKPIRKP